MKPEVEARILSALERHRAHGRAAHEELGIEPLPADVYEDAGRFERERASVFRRRWIPVARLEHLREPGAFVTFELAGDRLVAVRGGDGELRVLHNVCRHRGAQVLREERGRVERLRCPYHAFEYGLDGRLTSLPAPDSFPARIAVGETRLPAAASESFGGQVWVHLDAPHTDLTAQLGPAWMDELANWPLDELALVDRRSVEAEFDWKVGVEAFLEPLHVPAIHARTAAPVVDYRGMACRFEGEHSRMALPFRAPDAFLPDGVLGSSAAAAGVEPFPALNRAQLSAHFVYFVFPATVWMLFPNHALALLFLPTAPGRCRMTYELLAAPPRDERARSFLDSMRPGYDRLLEEDLENLPWIQRGVRDASLSTIEPGSYEERIRHFRRTLEAALTDA